MAEIKRCEQCGRTGTRGFRFFPAEDVIFDDAGQVAIIPALSMTECANKTACRKRWPKTRDEDGD